MNENEYKTANTEKKREKNRARTRGAKEKNSENDFDYVN